MKSSRPLTAAPVAFLSLLLASSVWTADEGTELQASHYHFIAEFSRDQLVVTEMLARPGAHQAGERSDVSVSGELAVRLPAGAVAVQASGGVRPGGEEVVVDLAEAGDSQYMTWKYVLPLAPGTMRIERVLPVPVEIASVMVQDSGPGLEVTWPAGAQPRAGIAHTEHYLAAGARNLPADAAFTIVLSGIPGPADAPAMDWLLWVVGAMVVMTVLALIAGPRRR